MPLIAEVDCFTRLIFPCFGIAFGGSTEGTSDIAIELFSLGAALRELWFHLFSHRLNP